MKLRNKFTILAVYSLVIGAAILFATSQMNAQSNVAASPVAVAAVSPTVTPALKPTFSLSTNRTYGTNDRAKIYVSYQNINALDFRVYKVKDPSKFFKQLNDPHRMGEDDALQNDTINEVKETKPGALEKVHDFKTSIWGNIKNYFRKQLNYESRVEFNVKFRGLGGESDRLPLNVADFARVPLLNQDQLVTSFRQPLANIKKYDSKMILLDKHEPGVYLIEAVNEGLRAYTISIVTDVTMVKKNTNDGEMLVYTVDRKSGEPRGGLNIEVIKGKKTIATGVTDKNGVLKTNVRKQVETPGKIQHPEDYDPEERAQTPDEGRDAYIVMAKSKDQFAISDLDAFYFDGGYEGDGDSGNLAGYIYTDRPVYRPKQKVFFKGILRKIGNNGYESPGSTVNVTVEDPNNGKLLEKSFPISARGTFNGEVELAEEAPLGQYNITAKVGEATSSHYFSVEEYKKPEYKVTVRTPSPFVAVGDKTTFDVEAKYFFGAPVANAAVQYYIYRSRYWHSWWSDGDEGEEDEFSPSGEEEDGGYGYGNDMVKEGEGKLDKDGKLSVEFQVPSPEEKQNYDFTYRIEAKVVDSSRREMEGKASFTGTRGKAVAFARPVGYVFFKDDSAKIKVKTADYEGKPVASKVTVKFIEHRYEKIEKSSPQGKWDLYEYKLKETDLGSGEVNTNAQGQGEYNFKVPVVGSIRIEAIINENGKQIVFDGGYLWVAERSENQADRGDYVYSNSSAIKLVPDKKSYKPGETAKVLALLPTDNAHLLVTTELENIKTIRTIKSSGRSALIEVPIDEKAVPNIYFSVCYVKDGEFYEQSKSINVPAKHKYLNLEIIPNKKEYKPREVASYSILARNSDGTPSPGAEVSLGVVDEAVYSIMPENAGDIRRQFYEKRYNRVQTSFSTQFYFVGFSGEKSLKIASNKPNYQLADFKNETQYAEPTIRKEFKDTAFWQPNVITGADGKATVSVPLPDNLTTWRATARGVTSDLKVGSSVGKVLARKDLILRLETPRFLTEGDTVTLSGIVHNYLDAEKSTKIEIEVSGAQLLDGASQTVTIPKQGIHRIDWRVKADQIGQVKLLAKALTDQESDAVELPLEVIPAGLQQTTGKALALSGENDEQSFDVNLPANAHAQARSLKLEAAPSLAGTLFGALDYLTGFPYGCTEQTMSRFMPNMIVTQALADIKGATIRKDNNLPAKVKRGIDKLSGLQHSDGGWGWWKDDKTDPFLTAYVVDGLSQAVKAGYGVESSQIERGREALKKMIEAHKAEDGKPIDQESQAYMVYSYTLSGDGYEKYLNDLFAQRSSLQPYGRAMLALALHARNDKRAAVVAGDIERSAKVSEYDAHWESAQTYWYGQYRVDLEATAYSLKALSRIAPGNPILVKVAHWIVANKTNAYGWMSTKHSAFAISGLIDYLKVSNELSPDYTVEVYLNGEQIHSRHVTSAETQPFVFERKGTTLSGNNQIRIVKRGRGVLYLASTLEFFSREENSIAQSSNNLKLTREYLRLLVKDDGTGKPSWKLEPLTGEVRSGDYIVSKLHLTGASARQVMIEDPIPAGCEQIESVSGINLNHTENNWCSWYSSREFRDNRTALFLDYFDGDDIFQYAMRVQIPGDFKIGPARAELMYQRTIRANTASGKQKILDKK